MREMMWIVLLILLGGTVFLWISDRKKWKRRMEELEKQGRNCLQQREAGDSRAVILEEQLEGVQKEQRRTADLLALSEAGREKAERKLSEERETVRRSSLKIHLYIQLLKEQCGTDSARKQCDGILRECGNLLEISRDGQENREHF